MALHQQCHEKEQCRAASKRKNATKSGMSRSLLKIAKRSLRLETYAASAI
jgi:hypothetical protein